MKKPALIRSDKPHAVQVTEGSSVAQRKSTAKKTATPESPEPLKNMPDATTVKEVKPRRVTAPKAPTIAEKASSPEVTPSRPVKARPKTKPPAPSVSPTAPQPNTPKKRKASPRKSPKKAKPDATALTGITASTPPTAPVLPVWEKDSAVKARIEELQALNAQLSEQLQRLPTNRSLRGAKP